MSGNVGGRPLAFTSTDDFEKGCQSYVDWVRENPVEKTVTASFQGVINYEKVPHNRPMTVYGLSAHLKIGLTTLKDYGNKDGFSTILARFKSIMTAWNIDGATSGDFNQSIVARIEGLAEKQESTTTVTVNSLDDFYAEQHKSDT